MCPKTTARIDGTMMVMNTPTMPETIEAIAKELVRFCRAAE
jgi:hypothetical protein